MPCHAAIIDKALTLSPDTDVETALKQMKKNKSDYAAVVDEKGVLIGLFSHQNLLNNLLPVSVAMADGVRLDVTVRATPGVAKRLKKVYPAKVSELMERRVHAVYPQTPIWEGVSALISYGSPIFVVEGENGKYMGMITSASALEELQRMQESEAS